MKKCIIALIMLLAGWRGEAQTEESYSSTQQMEFYKMQIAIAEHERNAKQIASVYSMIVRLCRENSIFENELPENLYSYGMWSAYAGNHQTAIDALIELLDMPDIPADTSLFTLKARANNSLGTTYFFLKRWDHALVHFQKARDMATTLQNNLGISIAENNIGNIYQKKGNIQQAIEHYIHCLQLQEEIDDKETICNAYHNLATCYSELGAFTESLNYFDLALNLAKEIGDSEIEALSLIGLARYYARETEEFSQALKLIAQAENIAKGAGYHQVLAEVYQVRSIIDEERGDFASALDYFKEFKMLSDTLFNEQSINQLHEYQVRYQTQEKELEILRQQTEIERQRTYQLIYIGGLALAGLLLAMLVYNVMLRTRRNHALAEMNAIKDKFFSIISHDLKNPAMAQHAALQLLVENANNMDTNTLNNYLQRTFKFSDGLVDLLTNLLKWSKIQTGRMTFNPTPFDLVAELQPDVDVFKSMAEQKNITFDAQTPASAIVTGDIDMIKTIVRNLMGNAVKFTDAGGRVVLEIKETKRINEIKGYVVSVSDDGVGITQEQIDNLFRIDRQHTRTGTAGEQSSGLGLIVCKDMLQKHGSNLNVESEAGKGSRFWFEV